jgi:hypothetical protein
MRRQPAQHHPGHAEGQADHGQRDADAAELVNPPLAGLGRTPASTYVHSGRLNATVTRAAVSPPGSSHGRFAYGFGRHLGVNPPSGRPLGRVRKHG